MNEMSYKKVMQWAEAVPVRKKLLCLLNTLLPVIIGGMYAFCMVVCFFLYPVLLVSLVLRPLLCFFTVTLLRYLLKFPRPYDVYDFVPLCGYHPGKGRSFPSRHTASAAIIAFEIFRIASGVGSLALILAVMMGMLRVLCGNHFIKDVLAAFVLAFFFYII